MTIGKSRTASGWLRVSRPTANQAAALAQSRPAKRGNPEGGNANDNTVKFEWDKLQRLTAITDALEHTISFSYDAESNLTMLKDPLDREYSWSYDDAFQTEEFEFPDQSKETYQYDANGNLTQLTNRANQEIEFSYDDANRRTQKTWKDSDDTVFTYTYDDADRRTGVTRVYDGTTQSNISYTHDAAGRITGVTAEGRNIGYGYDGSENLNLIEYPSGLEVHRMFDSRNLLSELRDESNNLLAEYTRDADGRITVREMGNGLEKAYTYNAANWITKIELRETATPSNVLRSFEYGHDDVGNRLWVEYEDGTGDVYRYDATYQITGVKYGVDNPQDGHDLAINPDRVVTYEYDAVGNRTTVVDDASSTVYTVNDLNQYTQVGSTSYTYSSRGDLTGDGTWTFGYDHEGRLISAEKTGTTTSYQYDAVGRRIGKTVNGVATEYVYAGHDLIEERDDQGAVVARYVYEAGIDRPVKVVRSSGTYYFAQDALGNVVALTDSSGDVVEEYRYDIFGEPEILDGSGNPVSEPMTPFLFTGREYDAETGLYHYRTRAYSPMLGRFLQPDSIDFEGRDVNLYRYTLNNPLTVIDPFGTAPCCQDCWDDYNTRRLSISRDQTDQTADLGIYGSGKGTILGGVATGMGAAWGYSRWGGPGARAVGALVGGVASIIGMGDTASKISDAMDLASMRHKWAQEDLLNCLANCQ